MGIPGQAVGQAIQGAAMAFDQNAKGVRIPALCLFNCRFVGDFHPADSLDCDGCVRLAGGIQFDHGWPGTGALALEEFRKPARHGSDAESAGFGAVEPFGY